MKGEHRIEVHMTNMISGKNDHLVGLILFDKINIAPDCVSLTLLPIGIFRSGPG